LREVLALCPDWVEVLALAVWEGEWMPGLFLLLWVDWGEWALLTTELIVDSPTVF
jgi:hypothetical protein